MKEVDIAGGEDPLRSFLRLDLAPVDARSGGTVHLPNLGTQFDGLLSWPLVPADVLGADRHLVPLPSVQQPSGALLLRAAPLLEEEWDAVVGALVPDRPHPLLQSFRVWF